MLLIYQIVLGRVLDSIRSYIRQYQVNSIIRQYQVVYQTVLGRVLNSIRLCIRQFKTYRNTMYPGRFRTKVFQVYRDSIPCRQQLSIKFTQFTYYFTCSFALSSSNPNHSNLHKSSAIVYIIGYIRPSLQERPVLCFSRVLSQLFQGQILTIPLFCNLIWVNTWAKCQQFIYIAEYNNAWYIIFKYCLVRKNWVKSQFFKVFC